MKPVDPYEVKNYIAKHLPEIRLLLDELAPVEPIVRQEIRVPEAVVRVIAGQMLSRKAASAIYRRVHLAAVDVSEGQAWLLPEDCLRACGFSGRKAKAVAMFAGEYELRKAEYDAWPELDWKNLRREVSSHWGLSEWTASILGIFYFGQQDIFPHHDGSIKRAMSALEHSTGLSYETVEKATPFRSYLAMYLWSALDSDLLFLPELMARNASYNSTLLRPGTS